MDRPKSSSGTELSQAFFGDCPLCVGSARSMVGTLWEGDLLERQPYIRLNFDTENPGRPLGVDQLVRMIRSQLLTEDHFKGCRLPPVRALAHQLGLSKNTIQAVYDELRAQGLVESKDRTGLFVSRGQDPRPLADPIHVPTPNLKNIAFSRRPPPKQSGVLMLSSVFVDTRILPVEKLSACFRSVLKSGLPEFYDHQGMPALRQKIATRLRDRGIDVDAEHIIITNGSQQALDLVTRVLASRVVVTEDPAYHMGKRLLEMNGIQAFGLPVCPFEGIVEDVWKQRLAEHRPGLAYLTTNFQNSNGYSYSSSEIAKIVLWAKEYGFGILEDDWGAEMLSYSEFKPGLRAMGGSNVLYMNSFTKKVLPSLRIGYLAANDLTVETLLMAKKASTIGVPALIEAGLFEFLDRGYYDTHLKNTQEELDVRYEHCLGLLRQFMPAEVKWTSPGGGPVLWLELPVAVDLDVLKKRLEDVGVVVQLSDDAYFGRSIRHGFKIGYAFLTTNEMEEALDKTAQEIQRQMRSGH